MKMVEIDLTGRVIIVTGSAAGIGRRIAERLLEGGAMVAGFDIRENTLEHPNFLPIWGDVAKEAAVAKAFDTVIERFGRLDGLVNNAGIVGGGIIDELALDQWSRVMDTNLTGAFLFTKYALRHLRLTQGAIVNIASTNGITGGSALSGSAYACSKAGMIALTKHTASENAADRVRANVIAPGPVDTEMIERFGEDVIERLRKTIPLQEFAKADDVADLALFLLSGASRHLTGVTIPLCGGLVM